MCVCVRLIAFSLSELHYYTEHSHTSLEINAKKQVTSFPETKMKLVLLYLTIIT